jgi:hypothetical protein
MCCFYCAAPKVYQVYFRNLIWGNFGTSQKLNACEYFMFYSK